MARALTTVLIVLALFNIAHADILKPCQCGPDNPMSCGQCPASKGTTSKSPAPCWGTDETTPEGSDDGDGCGICPGARAPRDVPAAATTLEAPRLLGMADLDAGGLITLETWLAARTERPATSVLPTWRVTPEGLTVFLI